MALALVKNGIKCRIIDKEFSFHVGSRGFGIQPRTFELMELLGIVDDVFKLATDIPTMRAYKPGGIEPTKTWDLYEKTQIRPDRPYGNGKCLSQSVLEEIFRSHLGSYDCRVELGTELIGFQQDAEGVTATIVRQGTSPSKEAVRAQFLVGADGAKGITRKLLGLTFQGETRDTDGMVWGDVEIQGLSNNYWHIWGKPGQFTLLARPTTPNGSTFSIGVTCQNFDPVDLANADNLIKFIRDESGMKELTFGTFTWLSYFKPNMRIVNKFSEGRVFLVGDIAHVHSPTGGQGMNCSVQDSYNLAWKIALVHQGYADISLLSTYNEERLPVITQMLHATTTLYTHTVAKKKVNSEEQKDDPKSSGWFRWRNNALHLYGVNYRWSSITSDERGTDGQDDEDMRALAYEGYKGSVRAGDRAPEAPGLLDGSGKETTLFHLYSPSKHTVLIFVPKNATTEVVVASTKVLSVIPSAIVQNFIISSTSMPNIYDSADILFDGEGHARAAYCVDQDEVNIVVVRPDGIIGAFATSAMGIQYYFSRILNQ
ncbi:uncharacterized protein FIBRA_01506 [Fibroporia radiculosa]|uniref:FAD-binding domain-containing protein n=1 Tax=Fibroporia radiculosa TaxID=599839 RepID=J4G110_9APHY|nr:uncharacterized protein FIBRA_01506 [Fibroporia radiculosa]CCL99488.1 predicted protein [Fibroporia radiculosa]